MATTNPLIIVALWARSIESYVAAGPDVEVARPKHCPACGGTKLIFWGSRRRQATGGGRDMALFIRRARCSGCGRTHTILPAFLFRGRVYLAEAIVEALDLVFARGRSIRGAADRLRLCRSTIRRWTRSFRLAACAISRRLTYLYHTHFAGAPPPPAGRDAAHRALVLCRYLFAATTGEVATTGQLARWLSAATAGNPLA